MAPRSCGRVPTSARLSDVRSGDSLHACGAQVLTGHSGIIQVRTVCVLMMQRLYTPVAQCLPRRCRVPRRPTLGLRSLLTASVSSLASAALGSKVFITLQRCVEHGRILLSAGWLAGFLGLGFSSMSHLLTPKLGPEIALAFRPHPPFAVIKTSRAYYNIFSAASVSARATPLTSFVSVRALTNG